MFYIVRSKASKSTDSHDVCGMLRKFYAIDVSDEEWRALLLTLRRSIKVFHKERIRCVKFSTLYAGLSMPKKAI